MREVLTLEYTSSDESDYNSPSEDEGEPQLVAYKIKRLSWERTQLAKAKKALDELHWKSLSKRARNFTVPRINHPQPSLRPIPINPLPWAVRMPAADVSFSSTPSLTSNPSLPGSSRTIGRIVPSSAISSEEGHISPIYHSTPRCSRRDQIIN